MDSFSSVQVVVEVCLAQVDALVVKHAQLGRQDAVVPAGAAQGRRRAGQAQGRHRAGQCCGRGKRGGGRRLAGSDWQGLIGSAQA